MTLSTIPPYDRARITETDGHAVVVGASMAGLLMARVLADGFETVTVLDRDSLPDDPAPRRSVPQANHVHVLLEAGRVVLEALFPGFGAELRAAGGLEVDAAHEFRHFEEGDFLAPSADPLPMYCASRPLIEHLVRRRVAGLDGVTIRSATRVTSYRTDDATRTVTGVRIDDGTAGKREVSADLVVDATGRTSRTPAWLESHGYSPPPVEELRIDVAYSTALLERPADDHRGLLIPPSPARPRGAAVVPIEDDRWQVTLIGVHGNDPPADRAAFTTFAGTLPVPDVRQILERQSWISESLSQYPFPSNVRRRYEALERFPRGLLVCGDGIASFNPIYGQGMSVAALEALVLHHVIATSSSDRYAMAFFDRAGSVLDTIWNLTVGADFGYPQTVGPKPRGTGLRNWYRSRLVRRAHTDSELSATFYHVLRLEQPPTTLLHPSVVGRVLLPIG